MSALRRRRLITLAATGLAGWREWQRLESLVEKGLTPLGAGFAPEGRRIGLRPKQIAAFPDAWRRAEEEGELEPPAGIDLTTVEDAAYPESLRQLPNPPLVLFHRGRLPEEHEFLVGIVGSRRASRYGRRQARRLGEELAARGQGVVSGLARGVDTEAHRGSLSGPGRAFAVLGSGLDEPYPPENVGLAMEIEDRGALLSEFAPGTPPLPYHFPRRNRIIAGLVRLVIVVEAAEKSGALITARWANDLGRDVAALPGPVDAATSSGALALLRDGARLMRGIDDLVEDGLLPEGPSLTVPELPIPDEARLEADDRRLLALLDREPTSLDALLGALDLAPGTVLARLLSLELRGFVERDEALRFALPR